MGSESRKDFIHKMKIGLKELRESFNSLAVTKTYFELKEKNTKDIEPVMKECNELIAIFTSSIKTAKRNMELEKQKN
jgi:four helix bundle protein